MSGPTRLTDDIVPARGRWPESKGTQTTAESERKVQRMAMEDTLRAHLEMVQSSETLAAGGGFCGLSIQLSIRQTRGAARAPTHGEGKGAVYFNPRGGRGTGD